VSGLATVEDALAALVAGRPVLVLDDADRENEGDVILAGSTLTSAWLAWTIRHSSGYVCAPMPETWADRLALPLMVERNEDSLRTAYTITVDAASGISTGISAADRARTISVLADPSATPGDLIRPGHVVPLRAREGGVLERGGHTEAAVDLCRLAGLPPVAAIAELVRDDGEMMRTPDVLALGQDHGLPVLTIRELVAWRERHDRVERVAQTVLPTRHGTFDLFGYRDRVTGAEHVALVKPRVDLAGADGVSGAEGLSGADGRGVAGTTVVRVHSECLTGDVLGSLRCDCGSQLELSLERVAADGGVVVYLRGHEGRGVGLLAKLAAYRLQDEGADTVDAQIALGLPIDDREYGAAAAILRDLGVDGLTLMSNNPDKAAALRAAGLTVTAISPVRAMPNPANEFYLRTKRDRLGHDVMIDATAAVVSATKG
jgi:3,4-dihydroxy 2-butanone 4-phosphate synthase / GTP cyclohydrolase II